MSELVGKVKVVNPEQAVSATFKKRELVVTTDEQYPQHILIEFTQDKCDLLNGLEVGQEVKVGINLRGREWVNPQGETKYFNQIQGWRVEKLDVNNIPVNGAKQVPTQPFEPANNFKEEEHDDLPF